MTGIFLYQGGFGQKKIQETTDITIDFNKNIGDMNPFWAFFGADEPNYAYMKDGKKLLTELSVISAAPVYFRTHNLLTSGHDTLNLKWGSTNVYTEDAKGNPIYDWTILDKILYTERHKTRCSIQFHARSTFL